MSLGLSLILASVVWGSWRSLLRLGCLDLVGGGRESPFFRVEGCFLVLVLAGSSCLGGMTSASLVGCLSREFLWVSVSGGRESLRPARTNRLPGLGASCRSFPPPAPPACGRWRAHPRLHTQLLWHDPLVNLPSSTSLHTDTHAHIHSVSGCRRGASGPMGKQNAFPVGTRAVDPLCQSPIVVWCL